MISAILGILFVAAPGAEQEIQFPLNCPRCVDARRVRSSASDILPIHAVVYSFSGEFATEANWWLIDLDNGRVVLKRSKANATDTLRPCVLMASELETIRNAAHNVWMSDRPRSDDVVMPPPGATMDAYLISGSKIVFYNPFQQQDFPFVGIVKATLERCLPK